MTAKLSIADDLEVSIFLTASSTSSSFMITGSILLSGILPSNDQGNEDLDARLGTILAKEVHND